MNNIDDRLDRIERKLDALLAALKTPGNGARPAGQGDIDADIDSPRGDPEVRFMPKRWSGADCKGQKFSTCEPEFLDMLADAYEWFAQRDDETNAVDKNGAPKSKWSRLDGARARAWAARLREQADPSATPAPRARPSMSVANNTRRAPTPVINNGRVANDFGHDNDDIPF